ncbi:MAG: hypothetical protein H6814_03990 [Phycisphaeraceae bacterium]|nr:hypothetical protein [Phycisphaeraceae bacterium]
MRRRVVLLYNPASGRGKAERFANELTVALRADGWEVERTIAATGAARPNYQGASAAVIIGGDGTAHNAAPGLEASGVPVYIAPMGTENLLSKELGMLARIDQIREAIRDGRTTAIDLPTVNGTPFLVMCSVGIDAAVVAEVNAARNGKIRKSTYLRPILRQALRPTLPELRIVVDGEVVCEGMRGLLVVANCRRYAVGLNPAREASMTDGLLDVVFYPMNNVIDAAGWALRSLLGEQGSASGFVGARGRVIDVGCADMSPAPIQIDGEPAPAGMSMPLRFIADSGTVTVLRAPAGPED